MIRIEINVLRNALIGFLTRRYCGRGYSRGIPGTGIPRTSTLTLSYPSTAAFNTPRLRFRCSLHLRTFFTHRLRGRDIDGAVGRLIPADEVAQHDGHALCRLQRYGHFGFYPHGPGVQEAVGCIAVILIIRCTPVRLQPPPSLRDTSAGGGHEMNPLSLRH